MLKETIICIIIVIAIFSLDIFTQGYTENTTSEITNMMVELRDTILNEETGKITEDLNELEKNWKEKHDKLAYYIEHDELEKVDTAIVTMKSYIETEDYSSAAAELDEGKFVLEHIQEKNAVNLQNIF